MGGCLYLTLSLLCVLRLCLLETVAGSLLKSVHPGGLTFLEQRANRKLPFLRLHQLFHHSNRKSNDYGYLRSKQFCMACITQHEHVWVYCASSEVNSNWGSWKGLDKKSRVLFILRLLDSVGGTPGPAEQELCISCFFSDFLHPLASGLLQA